MGHLCVTCDDCDDTFNPDYGEHRRCSSCEAWLCYGCGIRALETYGKDADDTFSDQPARCNVCDDWHSRKRNDEKVDEAIQTLRTEAGTGSLELTVAYAVIEKAIADKRQARPPLQEPKRKVKPDAETESDEDEEEEPEKRKAEAAVAGEPDPKRQKVETQ
jgi:hypothetical protein